MWWMLALGCADDPGPPVTIIDIADLQPTYLDLRNAGDVEWLIDLDADGASELVGLPDFGNDIPVTWTDGRPTEVLFLEVPGSGASVHHNLSFGDYDGDRGIDVMYTVISQDTPTSTLRHLRAFTDPLTPGADPTQEQLTEPLPSVRLDQHASVGDVDGDGADDFVTLWSNHDIRLLSATASPIGVATVEDTPRLKGATVLTVGDVDGDGAQDVFVSVPERGVSYLISTGNWNQPLGLAQAGTTIERSFFAIGGQDLDGDGRGDLLLEVGERWCLWVDVPTEGTIPEPDEGPCWPISGGAVMLPDLDDDGAGELLMLVGKTLYLLTSEQLMGGAPREEARLQMKLNVAGPSPILLSDRAGTEVLLLDAYSREQRGWLLQTNQFRSALK